MKRFDIVECIQGTPEWHQARLGKLCSSKAAEMLSKTQKGAEAAGRRNLRVQLALERLTGKTQGSDFQSQAMADGKAREADARALYEALTGEVVAETGFCALKAHQAGCSLDGHIGDFEGLIEVKSPIAATHMEYLKTGKVPGEYLKQITHAMWVTGADWCDWLSYQPDFPESLRVKMVRVKRDEQAIMEYEDVAVAFLAEVDAEVNSLSTLTGDW